MVAKRYGIAAAAILTIAGGTAIARHAVQAPGRVVPVQARITAAGTRMVQTGALVDGYVATDKLPGIVAIVGQGADGTRNEPVVFAAGHIGDEPGAPPADANTLWRVYSMTKPVTAMAAMMLIEDGRIRLDQPVSDFIPAFKRMTVQDRPDTLASHAATRPITIRHLLTHTAGLGYTIVTQGPLLKAYTDAGITPFTSDAKAEAANRLRRPPTLKAFADKVAALPLIAEPGTKWSYSIGLDVMGRVIEVASRQPFDRFLQRRIFTPLKMRSTYFTVPVSQAHRLASGYLIANGKRVALDPGATSVFLTPPTFPYGGAGLVTSAHDYDRFLHMLQNGGTLDGVRVLKPATVRLAMSNLLPAGVFYPGAVAATGGTTNPQGFGAGGSVTIADAPGGPAKGTYGWGGAAGTIAWVDPVRHVRATIMVNYLPGGTYPLRTQATKAIYADLATETR